MANENNKSTVLVAEDDEDDRLLLKEAVDELGFSVDLLFVEDGEELLDYLSKAGNGKANEPDLILLDLNMPKKDGRQALREIKETAEYSTIPVAVLTTSSSETDRWYCYDLGANNFITKPPSFDGLKDAVNYLLELYV